MLKSSCSKKQSDAHRLSKSHLNPSSNAFLHSSTHIEKGFRKVPYQNQKLKHLKLVDEYNGILSYAGPTSKEIYAFYKEEGSMNPVFLPCLTRILYGSQ